jgi:hypothetical protein
VFCSCPTVFLNPLVWITRVVYLLNRILEQNEVIRHFPIRMRFLAGTLTMSRSGRVQKGRRGTRALELCIQLFVLSIIACVAVDVFDTQLMDHGPKAIAGILQPLKLAVSLPMRILLFC